ncbi:hypothetical protein L218DRAFT_988602 [Marasmius fiardii PR-910]|nr:hypothetical protein L218DRAFT_988602 [Marasmius fiardii PR-910]
MRPILLGLWLWSFTGKIEERSTANEELCTTKSVKQKKKTNQICKRKKLNLYKLEDRKSYQIETEVCFVEWVHVRGQGNELQEQIVTALSGLRAKPRAYSKVPSPLLTSFTLSFEGLWATLKSQWDTICTILAQAPEFTPAENRHLHFNNWHSVLNYRKALEKDANKRITELSTENASHSNKPNFEPQNPTLDLP